jgi:hypothetical protein
MKRQWTRTRTSPPQSQRGTSLLVGLVMLVLLTLMAISAFESSNVNLRVVGNMQARQETLSAAQTAIETLLSSAAFIKIASPPPAVVVGLNGANYSVAFSPVPTCVSTVDIPTEDLDPLNAEDFKCIPSAAIQQSGILITGAPLPPSYCSNTRWKVTASATDQTAGTTNAVTTLEQGVAVRVSKAKALTNCP